jgi:hypothetical protein
MNFTHNHWIALAMALIIGALSWIQLILILHPNTRLTEAVHRPQWNGLPFALAIPVLVWAKLVFVLGNT